MTHLRHRGGRPAPPHPPGRGRDLSGFDIAYPFCDAVYGSLGQRAGLKEGIPVSWAVLSSGAEALLSTTLGDKESCGDRLSHCRDMVPGASSPRRP